MMRRVTLCLVLLYAVVAYGYPQRVTLYGIPSRDFQTSDQENPPAAPGTEDGTSDSADETGIYFNHGIYDPSEDNPYFYSSFPLIMTHMQEMMNRLRKQMDDVLRRFPSAPNEPIDRESDLDVFSLGGGYDLNDVKNKSTSKTEVIDGHEYVVNETVVSSGGDDHRAVFRIKTVQLKPKENSTNLPTDYNTSEVIPSNEHNDEIAEDNSEPLIPKNDDNNEIPNEVKVGSEVDDLNKEYKNI
ncbi:virus-induced RNA 1 [Lycorma delicatula]|uniref:virus-induced RNA 1 n=1 Tax=Lycorma delicatula TaxID=130591 RepID=UPI003F50FFDD